MLVFFVTISVVRSVIQALVLRVLRHGFAA